MQRLHTLLAVSVLGLGLLPACGDDGETFSAVLPNADMLLLDISEQNATALTLAGAPVAADALSTNPSIFQTRAKDLVAAINEGLKQTHVRLEALIADAEL